MEIEIEYIIKKRAILIIDNYSKAAEELQKTDWDKGHKTIIRKPEIISKRVLKDDIMILDKNDNYNIKKDVVASKVRITSIKDWLEILKEETNKIQKENPYWPVEKCKFMARKDMPNPPKDGWS